MTPQATPAQRQRLAALRALRRIDGPASAGLERLTRLAAGSLGMPMAWLSLLDDEVEWLQAAIGIAHRCFAPGTSPCKAAIRSGTVLLVPDLHADPRFAGSALAGTAPGPLFYAGAPLVSRDGVAIGSLCVMDRQSRPDFTPDRAECLAGFAALVMEQIEAHWSCGANAAVADFTEASEYGFVSIDGEGLITFVNPAGAAMFGYDVAGMLGSSIDLIIPEPFRAAHRTGLARIAAGGTSKLSGRTIELNAQHRDGRIFPIEFSLSTWKNHLGIGVGAILRDISEWRARDDALIRMAHHDRLTGLVNRTCFEERLQAALSTGHRAAVLLVDLEGFEDVNDSLGRGTGNALLQAVAVRLPSCVDERATVARLEGNQFAVLLPGSGVGTTPEACAQTILSAFQASFDICGHVFHLRLNIGAAMAHDAERGAEELMADADIALHQARRDGRRSLRLFDPAMRQAVIARRILYDDLTRAMERGELVLHYQPQVLLATGQVTGVEALLRWNHPRRGLLLPGDFIQELESHPLAAPIGGWIVEEACRQAASWRAARLPAIRVAVNLFGAQLKTGTLAGDVLRALGRYRLPPQTLEIEVTERIALQADDAALEPLRVLHAEGVAIAFDDFGTGYASLSSLKRFPLSRLKIDRSFVRDLLTDRQDAEIIRAILGMANGFGLDVIAEGIERVEQSVVLRAMGCREGQGYLYGKAMKASAIADLVRGESVCGPVSQIA